MNSKELQEFISRLDAQIPSSLNGADRADVFVYLAAEWGLTHLLMPEAVPETERRFNLPVSAPEFYQRRADRRERPCEFIRRVYGTWMGNGLAMHHLFHLDEPLYAALHNWLRHNEKPDWLDLPTKKELNDRALERLGLQEGDTLPYPSYYKGLKDKLRLYNAARNRRPE